jgi:hypothetical protein
MSKATETGLRVGKPTYRGSIPRQRQEILLPHTASRASNPLRAGPRHVGAPWHRYPLSFSGLGQGWGKFLMALAHTADTFRRNPFPCENLSLLSSYLRLFQWRLKHLLYVGVPGNCPAGQPLESRPQPPTKWATGAFSPQVKPPKREAHHTIPSGTEVKN